MTTLTSISAHEPLDPLMIRYGPLEAQIGDFEYRMFALWTRRSINEETSRTCTVYAIDERDAYFTFINLGLLTRSTPHCNYSISG